MSVRVASLTYERNDRVTMSRKHPRSSRTLTDVSLVHPESDNEDTNSASRRKKLKEQTAQVVTDSVSTTFVAAGYSGPIPVSSGPEKITLTMIEDLAAQFPLQKLKHRVPPIILKHQLYTVNPDRSDVDKDVLRLFDLGEIRMFKLGGMGDDFAVVLEKDVNAHVKRYISEKETRVQPVAEKFLLNVMSLHRDVSIQSSTLLQHYGFNENDVGLLFQFGVLVRRDMTSYWLSLPDMGAFVKNFVNGRKETLRIIGRGKGREMLQTALLKRKIRSSVLPNEYHIADIVGADLVKTIDTTSGPLLKLRAHAPKR
eukprot:CFRG6764T1